MNQINHSAEGTPLPPTSYSLLPTSLFAFLSLLAYGGLLRTHLVHGSLTHAQVPQTLAWVGLAFIAYVVMLWWAERAGRFPVPLLWGGAILFRLLLLFTMPTLSDDVYRYLWDGHVANQGVSPYAYPIDSSALDALDVPIRALANHAWMASPYLPAAQWLFGNVTWLLPLEPRSMQLTMVAIDLFNGILIGQLLVIAGLPRWRVAIYLWNPLVVVEIAHGAHIDSWMICLTLIAVWLTLGRWRKTEEQSAKFIQSLLSQWLAPVFLALATLTKILPALLMVIFFWRWRWWQTIIYGVVVGLFILSAGLRAGWGLVGPLDGHGLFAALRIYGDQWNFNSGLFHWMEAAFVNFMGFELVDANLWAKRLVALLLLALLGYVWILARNYTNPRTLLRLMAIPFMGYVLLTTTFHPWYLLILLAFVPFLSPTTEETSTTWLWSLPWLYLSGALFLSYLTYLDPLDLREYEWIRQTEWLPTLVLVVLGLIPLHKRDHTHVTMSDL